MAETVRHFGMDGPGHFSNILYSSLSDETGDTFELSCVLA